MRTTVTSSHATNRASRIKCIKISLDPDSFMEKLKRFILGLAVFQNYLLGTLLRKSIISYLHVISTQISLHFHEGKEPLRLRGVKCSTSFRHFRAA